MWKLDVAKAQMILLNKVIFAYNLLRSLHLPDDIRSVEQLLVHDVKAESYRMMVVNYLVALIGRKPNDKVSIFNNPIKDKKEQVDAFYKTYVADIKNLTEIRDKVYSHLDIDFDFLKTLSFEFIEHSISFLKDILDYKGAKLCKTLSKAKLKV